MHQAVDRETLQRAAFRVASLSTHSDIRNGRVCPPCHCIRSGDLDLDLPRLGLLGLGQMHGEHA
ncbi:MAG: hypothetical protein M1608_00620, partial [Candidatus Omnitrophica bacterium]|nr:hypothetical protein [Candidatus Omnitrophota bacterium]